jgi:hypothetical protein
MAERVTSQSPSRFQRLLLRAALLDGPEAADAWARCREAFDLASLDAGSRRLAPQLYRNLRAAGVRDARVDALRQAHLKTWSRNRVRFRRLASVVDALAAEGVDVVLLKGAALIPLAYRDYGARPMTDFDVLVRPESARRAIGLLAAWGWTPTLPSTETFVDFRHADELVDSTGQRLDLHWNALQECCRPGANDAFWEASEPLEAEGLRARTLCPADALLHVVMHGARWSQVQPAAWIADAAMLLRARADEIDWDRFVAQATARRLVVPVRGALRCLADCVGFEPPARVAAALAGAPTALAERVEHAVKISSRPLVGSLPVLWFDYARLARGGPVGGADLSFRSYLRCTFRVPESSGLSAEMLRLGARRVRAAASGETEETAGKGS